MGCSARSRGNWWRVRLALRRPWRHGVNGLLHARYPYPVAGSIGTIASLSGLFAPVSVILRRRRPQMKRNGRPPKGWFGTTRRARGIRRGDKRPLPDAFRSVAGDIQKTPITRGWCTASNLWPAFQVMHAGGAILWTATAERQTTVPVVTVWCSEQSRLGDSPAVGAPAGILLYLRIHVSRLEALPPR